MDPAVFEALRIICAHKDITFTRTGIGDEGIDADYVPPLGPTAQRQQKRARDLARGNNTQSSKSRDKRDYQSGRKR